MYVDWAEVATLRSTAYLQSSFIKPKVNRELYVVGQATNNGQTNNQQQSTSNEQQSTSNVQQPSTNLVKLLLQKNVIQTVVANFT